MIFIVDDDEATRDSLRFLLECEGLEAEGFASGAQFVANRKPSNADCLIFDVNMPGISGLELLEQLREQGSEAPAIIITGQPTAATRRRAFSAGALAILEKPFNGGEIIDTVQAALGRSQQP